MIDEKAFDNRLLEFKKFLDECYVHQDDCTRQVRDTYGKIEDVKVSMAGIKSRLDLIIAILGAIGAAAIGICAFVIQAALKI